MPGASALGKRTPATRPDDTRYATSQSVTTAYGMATRGFPIKTRPVDKMVAYFGAAGHGWTGNAGWNLNDTSTPMKGSQSITATVAASGSQQIDSPTLTAFSVQNHNIRLTLRYTGDCTGILVYLASDTGFVNRVNKNVLSLTQDAAGQDYVTEVSISDFTSVSGTPDLANVIKVRIIAQAGPGGCTVSVGDIAIVKDAAANLPNGAVIFSADDSNIDHWNLLRPKLAQYGYAATLYPNFQTLSSGSGYYTATQAKYMQDVHGFDFGSHCIDTAHHIDHVGQTEAWLRDHFEQIITQNKANGFRGNSFAWPNTTSDALARRVAADYFRSARGGSSVANEVHPVSNPMNMRAINCGSYTIAQLKAYVDRAKSGHSVAHFFMHSLPVTKSGANDLALADMQSLVDYVAAQGVTVLSMSQLLDLPVA